MCSCAKFGWCNCVEGVGGQRNERACREIVCIIFGVFHEFFLKNFFIFSYYVFLTINHF